jgi:hypothetical protein
MQRQNTEPPGEDTVKHERSGGKSLKRKKKGPCSRCFSRPKDEGDVPDAFPANGTGTATYVPRKDRPCSCRSLSSIPTDFHVLYDHLLIYLPHFEATSLGSSI